MKITHSCNIIVLSDACDAIKYAADELEAYLKKILPTCVTNICEKTEDTSTPKIVLEILHDNSDDTFRVYEKGGSIYISGSTKRSVIYAVYSLLEHIGCRFFVDPKI